jgi:PAS domain S-box-containing protein
MSPRQIPQEQAGGTGQPPAATVWLQAWDRWLPLAEVAVVALLFAGYEALKERFVPGLTRWHSHLLSIGMVAGIGSVVVWFAHARLASYRSNLLQHMQMEEYCRARRKRAEEQLRQSTERLQLHVQQSSLALIEWDAEFRVVCWNPAAERIFGYSAAEAVGQHVVFLVPPAARESVQQVWRQLATGHRNTGNTNENLTKDGRIILCKWYNTPLTSANGKLVGAVSLAEDVTEQRRLEESLRASEQRHRLFAENVTDAIWTMNMSGQFTYMSPSVRQMLGYAPEEVCGLPVFQILTPPSVDLAAKQLAESVAEAQAGRHVTPGHMELEFCRKDGSTFWGEISFGGTYDAEGKLVDFQGITRDITGRRQAEERQTRMLTRLQGVNRLQEELLLPAPLEEKFKKITAVAVKLLDLDFCRIWQAKPGDLCAEGCIHATAADESHACRCRTRCLHLMASSGRYTHVNGGHRRVPVGCYKIGRIASGENNKFLTNSVTTDPQVADHEWAKSLGLVSFAGYKLRGARGEPFGVLAMFAKHPITTEDDLFLDNLAEMTSMVISDAQAGEELRRTREQAIAASRAKSTFLATMSHEIRTPMTVILGYADLLLDPSLEVSTRNNYLAVVRRSGEQLLCLINDVLDLSKIEAGKLTLNPGPCNLMALLAEVAGMMQPRAQQRGNSLAVEYAGEIPQTVHTDGARLRQALVNLVGNAVKFTEHGSVRIRASFLPQWRPGRPAVKIEVIDTGIGIRRESLGQLFQPFTQVDDSTARKYGGSGLGLAISRQLADMLGGEVTVKSEFGRGSNFTLTVPTGDLQGVTILQSPDQALSEPAEMAVPSTGTSLQGVRILLAEDGFDSRQLIGIMLRNAGAQVEVAENGRQAVDQAQADSFDMILMDMNMPVMDGYEAARLLRSQGYERPILALTANAMAEDAARCLQAGCNDHLTKPIDRLRLIQAVDCYARTGVGDNAPAPAAGGELPRVQQGRMVSEFLGDPDIAPILGEFVARLDDQVDQMRQSLADDRYQELQRQAHMLKGSAGGYGYPALTEACQGLERAAEVQNTAAAAAAMDRIAWMCDAIIAGHQAAVVPAGKDAP